MAFTTIDNPELFFQNQLYTGNGGTQSITLDGSENMQPDWVWIKNRSGSDQHSIYDSVRGANKVIRSSNNSAEGSQSDGLTSFDSDGFSVGAAGSVNTSSNNFVSWNWKAGTSFSNDASATSVGSIDSSGSINTTAGFSIITYTGTGSAATFAHGLSAVPKWILFKKTSGAQGWGVYHASVGNTGALAINTTDSTDTTSNYFNNTSPTSSVVTVNTNNSVNNSGGTIIAYCFAEKQGYSKFGSYTGNGNADGTFVYTGFKPAWLMMKPLATASWRMWDNKREDYNGNVNQTTINANESDAEYDDSSVAIDFLSNGFKGRSSNSDISGSGTSYIYMAFAESPFVNSNGVPNNAE